MTLLLIKNIPAFNSWVEAKWKMILVIECVNREKSAKLLLLQTTVTMYFACTVDITKIILN